MMSGKMLKIGKTPLLICLISIQLPAYASMEGLPPEEVIKLCLTKPRHERGLYGDEYCSARITGTLNYTGLQRATYDSFSLPQQFVGQVPVSSHAGIWNGSHSVNVFNGPRFNNFSPMNNNLMYQNDQPTSFYPTFQR